ncbi:MAG: hypothetical protein ACR2NX_14710 [Chthoniobacterales bacterium]
MKKSLLLLASFASFLVLVASPANALSLGQVDTFFDGAGGNLNWVNGASQVSVIGSGGPGGAGDAYLQVTSTGGGGAGSRLVAQNYQVPPSFISQWVGNYISTGVNAISFDLLNQSAVTLTMRLAFKTDTGQGASGYLSQAVTIAPGGGWQHFSIAITSAAMTAIGGPAAYSTFFAGNFTEMRFINEAGNSNLNGDPVAAVLGIDNIAAVPEPTTLALGAAGLVYLGSRVLRRKLRVRDVTAL